MMSDVRPDQLEDMRANEEQLSRRPRRVVFWLPLLVIFLAIGWAIQHFLKTGQPPFLRRESVWSVAIYEGPSPFELEPSSTTNEPVLVAEDVTDVPALFVADPFMVKDGDSWFMFIEVLNNETSQGDIGVATSTDGRAWKYDRIVLDEPCHLSYPSVFRVGEKWYMLPQANDGVHFYEATSFPFEWKRIHTVLSATDLADPTLFRHDDTWWMFVGKSGSHDALRLFWAADLFGDWKEHPSSPLIVGDPDTARPGGPVIQRDGQLFRLAQDCAPRYGNQLRGFRITKLTKTEYAEEPLAELVLQRGSHDWNATGMHHCDVHQLDDGRWRAVVDGHCKKWVLQATP